MQGYTLDGMFPLAGDFPPSVNTSDDSSQLEKFESPACYGVNSEALGRLSTGSIPAQTDQDDPTKTVDAITYSWFYNRLWKYSSGTLYWGAPYYDDVYLEHGLGKLQLDNDIVDIQRAFGNQLWLITANGSYFINGANSRGSDFEANQFVQELKAVSGIYAITVGGIPVVSNSSGVFMWTGSKLVELTRPVRTTLGNFGQTAIKADYLQQKVATGFLYTTPTMSQARGHSPFTVNTLVLSYSLSSTASATISWQSKSEDGDWFTEEDIEIISGEEGQGSRLEAEICNPNRSAHTYAFRITSMSSNVAIEEIFVNVAGLAVEASAE